MTLCPLTLKAVGGALGTEVLYLCSSIHLVEDEPEYFICVGERAFYFLDDKLNYVKGYVVYKHLQRIIVDQNIETIVQIHLSEHKERNMPLKMNLICFDRKNLVYYLNYAWKTDLMNQALEVKDLPIYKSIISISDKPNKKAIGPPPFMFQTRQENQNLQDEKFYLNNYVFHLNAQFQNKQSGVYVYKLFLQVTNPIPIQVISKMGLHGNLEQYCIRYMENIVHEYNIKKYYIEYSNPYSRRHNLTEDKSQWKGWEMQLITSNPKIRQLSIIILRRMFLPPLFENFNDIIIVLFSNSHAVNQKKGKIEARHIADSLYSVNMSLPIYLLIVEDKCNSLSLEESNYEFLLRHDPPIKPLAIKYAFMVIRYMFNKIMLNNSHQKRVKLKEEQIITQMNKYGLYKEKDISSQFRSFKELIDYVQDQISNIYSFSQEEEKSLYSQQDLIKEGPSKKMLLRQNSNSMHIERNSATVISKLMMSFSFNTYNWRKKISKYITFCIDGGIFGDRFTLVDVIEGIQDQACKKDCQECLEYCLFMFSEEGDLNFTGITKQIEKSIQNLNNFNERVMIQLIKNHYFYNFYIEQEVSSSNVYQQLMIYFLMEHSSLEIKKAVCYHLIDKLKKKSDEQGLPNHANQVLNELVTPLMYLYARSEDVSLSLYACIALQNILVQVSDAKSTMIHNNCWDIILEKLDSPHQKIVNYTLKFIFNLFDGMNSSQTVNMNIVQDKVVDIISSYKGMTNCVYNVEVVCTALGLIRKFLTSNDNEFVKIRESIDKFYRLMLPAINKEVDDYYCDVELQEQTIGVISQLASLDKNIQDEIARRNGKYHDVLKFCIDLILNLVNEKLLERALHLIIVLCQDRDDLVTYLKTNQLFYSALKFLRFDSRHQILPSSSLAQKLNVGLWLFSNGQELEDDPKNDPKSTKKKR